MPEGFPWDDFPKTKMSMDDQSTKWGRKIAENFNRLTTAHECYRQTDDRQTADRRTGDSI